MNDGGMPWWLGLLLYLGWLFLTVGIPLFLGGAAVYLLFKWARLKIQELEHNVKHR